MNEVLEEQDLRDSSSSSSAPDERAMEADFDDYEDNSLSQEQHLSTADSNDLELTFQEE
jgi:hypothetical protein